MPPNAKPLVIFMHIPKAAGSTIVSVFEQEFRGSQVCRFRQSHPIEEQVDAINRDLAGARQIRIVTGHIGYGLHELLDGPTDYITFLREPISLIVSRYHYRRRDGQGDDPLAVHAAQSSLEEFASAIEDNTMTRFLAGAEFSAQRSLGPDHSSFRLLQRARVTDPNFRGDEPCSDEMLALAKQNLTERFAAFGITDRFDESLVMFAQRFGWKRIHYIKQNVGKAQGTDTAFSPDTRRFLIDRNRYDVALYDYACNLFEERVQALGPSFSEQVAQFQRNNPTLGRLNAWRASLGRVPGKAAGRGRRIARTALRSVYPKRTPPTP